MMTTELLEDPNCKMIRDPVWGYISVPRSILSLIDTPDFQRLRGISQLGHVSLVYPGAVHTRFEHSLGVFHLAKRFLDRLLLSSPPLSLDDDDIRVFLAAAVLHDIGHYPFSHLLEEMPSHFCPHERRARMIIEQQSGQVFSALRNELGVDPGRVANVIDYRAAGSGVTQRDLILAGILSGTLDPDKIDYLLRDALYCGVPFGSSVNRDRLISSIKYDPLSRRLAITRKGIDAVEALIFTNYLMYRNVYWHHTVRAASAMFKRAIEDLMVASDGNCALKDTEGFSEYEMLEIAASGMRSLGLDGSLQLLAGVSERRLYKAVRLRYPPEKRESFQHYFADLYRNPSKRRSKEIELCTIFSKAAGVSLSGHEILIDIPRIDKSPEIDLQVFFEGAAPGDPPECIPFDSPEVTVLTASLIENFEAHAKIFRIFCIDNPGLRDALSRHALDNLL